MKEGVTQPPKHLQEWELIARMDRLGIGTDASISTHVETIATRNYVKVGVVGMAQKPSPLTLPFFCLPLSLFFFSLALTLSLSLSLFSLSVSVSPQLLLPLPSILLPPSVL